MPSQYHQWRMLMGTNQEAPHYVREDQREDGGTNYVCHWFLPRGANAPEKYDECVPDRRRSGWVVYILVIMGILICACLPTLTQIPY